MKSHRLNRPNAAWGMRLLALCLALLCSLLTASCGAGNGGDTDETSDTVKVETTDAETTTEAPDPRPEPMSVVDASKRLYGYDEMEADLLLLEEHYGELLSVRSLGKSLDDREIYCAVLGDESAEKQIVIHAGVHGREYMTTLLTMRQLEYYLSYYDTATYEGEAVSSLFSDYCFYVIPMANPDGVMISQGGSVAIRNEELRAGLNEIYKSDAAFGFATTSAGTVMDFETYLRYWKANARGVDLNRNYDAGWEEYSAILTPCFRNYKGDAPASEPETQAMISLVNSLSNPVAVISMHAQGNVLYWDCGQEDTLPGLTLVQAISDLTGYRVIYEQSNDASFNDWVILKKGLPSVTVEIGKTSCPLPIEEFPEIWEECRDLWAMLARLYE